MTNDPGDICKLAWRGVLDDPKVDPSFFTRFDDKCLKNMSDAGSLVPSKQCAYEHSGDEFVLDKKKQKIEMLEAKIISCLVRLATDEKWLVTEPAEEPKIIDIPTEVTSNSNIPNTDVIESKPDMLTGWMGAVSGFFGTVPTQVGMSANGNDPLHLYTAPMYFGATIGVLLPEITLKGTLMGRIQLDAVFESIGFRPKQDQDYSGGFHVWDLGPRLSLQGIYPPSKDIRVFFGPYLGYLMGGLSTDSYIEVVKGKGYDTDGKFSFITNLLYGLLVGAEQTLTDSQRAAGFCRLSAGVRQFFWQMKPDSPKFPATLEINKASFSGMLEIGVEFK